MKRKSTFGKLSDAQLFALGRLVHLHDYGFGDPCLPVWVIASPMREAPYHLEGRAFDQAMAPLAKAGWIEWRPLPTPEGQGTSGNESDEAPTKSKSTSSKHAEDQVRATDKAMAAIEALRAEILERRPKLPDDLASLILLSDIVRSPDGMDEDDIRRALEEPPAALTEGDALKTYRRLIHDQWIFLTEEKGASDQWYPNPAAWAHAERIDAMLLEREPQMRSRVVEGNADVLELGPNSALRKALREVDRAMFVPDSIRRLAYRNKPAPIAHDAEGNSSTTTSSPNVCALVVKQLEVEVGNRVLVCGVKAGFTAALCAHIVGPKGRVICLETNPLIAEYARERLKQAGFDRRVEVRLVKDVTVGLEDQEPWDAVVVNGKIPKVPRPIIRQMTDGGRLLIFLQQGETTAQTAFLIRKNGKAIDNKELSTFLFTPIYGEFGYDPPNWPDDLHLVGQVAHDVFVSYSTQDQTECDRIVQAFEHAGLRCWMSARNHPVGKDGYEQAIMAALKTARLFLIVLSHQSLASDHVKNELTNATSLRKACLPVRLTECPSRLPANFQYHLERHQQFDLDKHDIESVIAAALQLVGSGADLEKRTRPTTPEEPETPSSQSGSARFTALMDAVLADNRITKTELKLLVKEAVAAGIAPNAKKAEAHVIQMATEKSPKVKLPK